ncbi:MAG: hypothetical protein KF744_00185 [Taibaiella sp.]|nr:hypothetical protein [Taibaiella sp.]
MYSFRVDFKDNIAVSAQPVLPTEYTELKELKLERARTVLKWCIVDAEQEADAIAQANRTAKERWGSILGIR